MTGRERIEGESKFARWYRSSSYDWFMLGFITGTLSVGLAVWLLAR